MCMFYLQKGTFLSVSRAKVIVFWPNDKQKVLFFGETVAFGRKGPWYMHTRLSHCAYLAWFSITYFAISQKKSTFAPIFDKTKNNK